MAGERTPILPSSSATTPAANPRRRVALIAAAVVALVTLAVVLFNVVFNFSSAKAPVAAATGASSPATAAKFTPTVTFPADAHGRRDVLQYCEEKFITQNLNQFVAGGDGTYEQRYFVCGKQFFNKENGTIFFYNGNEADVLLYLNNTGLMWENAEEFNAVMVFAEHRYFGKSIPFGDDVLDHMQYLSSTQALVDFAVLIEQLKDEWKADVPVIGFGGSYGGMLGTWFRLKYPHLMDGVIAGSAPVLHFENDPDHPVDSEAYLRIVTFDMSPAAGASENCIPNVRKASAALLRLGATAEGRQTIAEALKLCNPEDLQTREGAEELLGATVGAFGSLAMGNYPYPSSYMTEGAANLPAYPVRAACEYLAPDFGDDDKALLAGLRDAAGVLYNATGDLQCYFPTPKKASTTKQAAIDAGNFWGYLECSELYMPSSSDGVHDVFPPNPLNTTSHDEECFASWGVHLRPNWAETQYGGLKAIRASSNIVFSNGNYDPWSGTGVLESQSESLVAVPIDGGAHHVDLFFAHPMDPPSLTQARETEKEHMRKWIREFYAHKAALANATASA